MDPEVIDAYKRELAEKVRKGDTTNAAAIRDLLTDAGVEVPQPAKAEKAVAKKAPARKRASRKKA